MQQNLILDFINAKIYEISEESEGYGMINANAIM